MSLPTEIRCNTCGRVATAADRFCGFCGARLDFGGATPTDEITGPHRPHSDRIQTALRAATIGEYDVAGEIGRGGMAVVFLAHDLSLNRKVAIKALLPELLYTEGMDRRFKHEARIAAKLDHPNILVIHAVREANDLLFIVMKLVEGLPLSAIAKVAGPLPIPVVRLIVRYVADALAYAHGEGVIHRDVKPANIMVDRRGNVIVMDFGIAKAADDSNLTRTGLVIGTPAYMSPEQCLAQGVTSASDQYSLGVVAYELLTGRTPFRGSALEMQWSHATAGPPSVRALRPDCPPDLESLVLRMLGKNAGDRWPSLHDVSHALADEPATAAKARATLITLLDEAPGRRDSAMPTTPASPVPIGPGPVVAIDATTDPIRHMAGSRELAGPSSGTSPNVPQTVDALMTLSQQRIELASGDSVELIVELEAGEQSMDTAAVTWESSDPNVARVSSDGYVTAVGAGLAEIACVWRGRRAVCLVQVTPPPSQSVPASVMAIPASPRAAVAHSTPAPLAPATATPKRRWWLGVLAASVVWAFGYLALRPGPGSSPLTAVAVNADTAPGVAAPSPSAPNTKSAVVGEVATPPAPPPRPTDPNPRSSGAKAAPEPQPRTAAAQTPTLPPPLPLPRVDSSRLITNRTDSSVATSSTSTAPTPARDSAVVIPAAPREVASDLFKEFATAINQRAYTRITAAYSQPTEPADVKLWQEFLVFVRDYSPRATVRSVAVNSAATPPTITAEIVFRWSSDAGFDRARAATFVGVALPAGGSWQLHRASLTKKFW